MTVRGRPFELNLPALLLSSLSKRLRRSGVPSVIGFIMGSIGGGMGSLDSSTEVFKLSSASHTFSCFLAAAACIHRDQIVSRVAGQ